MDVVRKVPVPEDVYRALITVKSDLNHVFSRRFCCTAELIGPGPSADSAPVMVYEKRLHGGQLISVWRDDLTKQDTDVVVNAANDRLEHVGGLAYALVEAGGQQIARESKDWIFKNGPLVAGDIAVTGAGILPSKAIVHAVGPVWVDASAEKCMAQLQEAIRKVLQYVVTDSSDLRSVAIPAISSGIFGFPLHLCADTIVETVHTFCKNEDKGRLKEIRLVNNDNKTVEAMRVACEKILGTSDTQSSAASASHSTQTEPRHRVAYSQNTLSINGLNLHLKTGTIEDEKTDVIVNSISSNLNLSSGAISAAIYSKAGQQLQDEIKRKGHHRHGNMIPTQGYNLPCRFVYHVILPLSYTSQAEKTLQEVTKDCLVTAHRHGSRSISFPALGTGNIGLQKQKVADIMTQTVLDFARANQCKMDVYFVIHPSDTDTFKAFQDRLKLSGIISDKNMEFTENWKGLELSADEMCVSIAGLSSDDVMEAAAWLLGLLSSSHFLIHNNLLLLFGSSEFDALASGPPSVGIEEDLRDGRVTLKISGSQPGRVMAAIQAERLLFEVQDNLTVSLEAELLEAAVIWFYDSQSESHRYSTKASRELEKAYVSRTNITLKAPPGHVIDIMKLTAQERERKITIHRRCLCDSLRNVQTSAMPETKPVDQASQEFRDRSNEFKKADLILVKMEKVQNKLLSGVFQSKKEAVEERQKKKSTEQLYQLVPGQFWKMICHVGFHKLYSSPRDTKHGVGIHFKRNLHNITQRFHVPDKDGLIYILQAEVVIGDGTKYNRSQPVLPCVGSAALPVYEHLADGVIPKEHYVIFDRFQANPQYVFTCRRKE